MFFLTSNQRRLISVHLLCAVKNEGLGSDHYRPCKETGHGGRHSWKPGAAGGDRVAETGAALAFVGQSVYLNQ